MSDTEVVGKKLGTVAIAKRYGVDRRTVDRWEKDERMNFPKFIRIRGRKYRDLAELEKWEKKRAVMNKEV
jgi:predicted DNA-binding transcriptional regulator AlpA